MITCRFYSPSKLYQQHYPTSEFRASTDFPYDRLAGYSACTQPELRGINPCVTCGFDNNQPECPVYEADEPTIERSVDVEIKAPDNPLPLFATQQIRLENVRTDNGVVTYRVTLVPPVKMADDGSIEYGEPIVLQQFPTSLHEQKAYTLAQQMFDEEVEERSRSITESITTSPHNSYLQRVLA